jgi:DNA-binding Lrp family transcriptional regulator
LKDVKTKKSKWTTKADEYFKGNTSISNISKTLGVSKTGLNKIIKKGEGAYYSSGSRPNVTARQWGLARLYSVLFGGSARSVDKDIVKEYKIPLIRSN